MERFFDYKKEIFLILIVMLCLVFLIFENLGNLTGNVTEGSTPSNVSVMNYIALSSSQSLINGIQFGTVIYPPFDNLNATHNYDGVGNETTFYLNVSNDTISPVDFCIRGSGDLINPIFDAIGLGNETYSNSIITNSTSPFLSNEISLTTIYVKSQQNVSIGGINYYRFWLDLPSDQSNGNYNNTIFLKAVLSGNPCYY